MFYLEMVGKMKDIDDELKLQFHQILEELKKTDLTDKQTIATSLAKLSKEA